MFEFLFLLLPVAAASGWWMARRQYRNKGTVVSRGLSPAYFKGLNYLLNEQPDKAIEVFVKMVEVDSETVETHLALGNLFRRRGEVDRAIRIHQNIIARPTLSRQQRSHALYELGMDYMNAGLLDRAENLFQELLEIGDYVPMALKQLTEIYESEKDWEKAIEIARRRESVTAEVMNNIIAQYYCEMAELNKDKGNLSKARNYLKRALAVDEQCVRASLLMGDIEQVEGNHKAALKYYKRVEAQDPEYIPVIVTPVTQSYEAMNRQDELENYLSEILARYGGTSPLLSMAEIIKRKLGDKEASEFIIQHMKSRPSVRGLDYLIDLNISNMDDKTRGNLIVLRDLTKSLLVDRSVYICGKCGFKGKTLHWQCPSCKCWNSIKPIRGVTGE
jgi:lipopolysaccharide biosynthesis regulator YciM